MAGLFRLLLALAMLQALAFAQPSCSSDRTSDLDADHTSLLMKHTTHGGDLAQLSHRKTRDDIDEINQQLEQLEKAYDGKITDQDTAEINWKEAQDEIQRMKEDNAEAAAEAKQALADAATRAIELLKECEEGCPVGFAVGGILEVVGMMGPLLTTVLPSIAPFAPLIGVIGTLLSTFFGPESYAEKPLDKSDVEDAVKDAMTDMGLLEIYADWTAMKDFFEDKTQDYNKLADTLKRSKFSPENANQYILHNFANMKWQSGDGANFDEFIKDMGRDYMKFAGSSDDSMRATSMANKMPFTADCGEGKSVCRHGGLDAYLCTYNAFGNCGGELIKTACWEPFNKVREDWPKILQVVTSYQLLASQMRLWQISMISIVSFARGTKDPSGDIIYPAYTKPGGLIDSVNNRLKPVLRLQDKLKNLVKNIKDTCSYQGYPLTQYCNSHEDCNFRYAYVRLGEKNEAKSKLLLDRYTWRIFRDECQNLYDRLSESGYAQGGMFTTKERMIVPEDWDTDREVSMRVTEGGPCGHMNPDTCCATDNFHLYAVQEYCVTHEPCRDLFVNSSHWVL